MQVEIWSDVVCPWCYIGKRRFEAAMERFAHGASVDIVWKSFELDRSTRTHTEGSAPPDYADRLAHKYRTTLGQAQGMIDSMTAAGAVEGLDFRFDRAMRANTFRAHQVIHLAGARGAQGAVKERLLRAYFTEGEAIGDAAVLARLGAEAGLDDAEVRHVLAEQTYAAAVRADEAEATRLGISAVPFFVVDGRYGIAGAQPTAQILVGLELSWARAHPLEESGQRAVGR